MIDWEPRAKQLAETLVAKGAISDSAWRVAFEQTPRHLFVPRYWARDQYNIPVDLIDGADPSRQRQWLDSVYADQVLITQWQPRAELRIITSSASQPSLVAHMLHILDVKPEQQVLEIGTGTGYNTALLCHRGATVATVDIDPVLVAEAQSRLAKCGYRPVAAAGDGAAGLPSSAPYDRILSTCAAATVPRAWIDQLADGGLIVAPLTVGGALAILRKTAPGQVTGSLDTEQAYFMPLHPAGEVMPRWFTVDIPEPAGPLWRTTTCVPLDEWADPDFRLWLALHRSDWNLADAVGDDGRTGMVVYTSDNRAEATYLEGDDGAWSVVQDQARLWDTIEAAWQAWQRYDRPSRTRIGITAHVDGQQFAWLDSPDGPFRWPLPSPRQ